MAAVTELYREDSGNCNWPCCRAASSARTLRVLRSGSACPRIMFRYASRGWSSWTCFDGPSVQVSSRLRRAISVPLTPVIKGVSRSLADRLRRWSGHVSGQTATDSQADSAGSIPVIRSNVKAQVGSRFRTLGLRRP